MGLDDGKYPFKMIYKTTFMHMARKFIRIVKNKVNETLFVSKFLMV